MDYSKILKQAVKKAKKNGYKGSLRDTILVKDQELITGEYYALIFSPAFAEAFWGNEHPTFQDHTITEYFFQTLDVDGNYKEIAINFRDQPSVPHWKMHVMVMAAEEEPLNYIKRFL